MFIIFVFMYMRRKDDPWWKLPSLPFVWQKMRQKFALENSFDQSDTAGFYDNM